MKNGRKLIASLLAILMLSGLLATGGWAADASASESTAIHLEAKYVNPLYADVLTEADLVQPEHTRLYSDGDEIVYLTDIADAAAIIREGMKAREETIEVYYRMENYSQDAATALMLEMADAALVHTGEPTEGDYLMWQNGGFAAEANGTLSGAVASLTITYTYTYYTTAEEEAKVDAKVEALLEELDLSGRADYAKIKAVYDYLCANVVYDHDHLNDETYTTQFTAYGALIDGTCVCQGYAVALYRLALELDVDCRLIAGLGNGEAHGWNIVKLDGSYYNADSTWDAGETEYGYFLVSEDNFPDHTRDSEYDTDEFHAAYPMAESNYVPCDHSYDSGKVTLEPTCTETGVRTYTCTICGDIRTEAIAANGHSCTSTVVDPTCTAEGYTQHNCTVCGYTYTDTYTDMADHRYTSVTVAASCSSAGYTQHTCTECGYKYSDQFVDPLEHTFEDGACTACGARAVYRIYGETRYETSFAIADALKEELCVTQFSSIIVASGTNFADALAGSYLAAVKDAPILLANGSNDADIKAYIQENLATGGTVYLLGGTAALPASLETALSSFNVSRLWGETRYETNLAILEEAGVKDQEILICTGTDFADSISASATGKPVLLVGSSLTEGQKDFLNRSSSNLVIIGGENAVSASVGLDLQNYGTVERLAGETRYETSILVAERFFADSASAVLTYSHNFPDGLCGGPLACITGSPLILTATGREADAVVYTTARDIRQGYVLGGDILISDDTVRAIFNMAEDEEINIW